METIEPKILPLVDALNATGIVRTFSSCEGHYDPADQTIRDRNHAEVRFVPAAGHAAQDVEQWLGGVLVRFKKKHGVMPMQETGYKLFTPFDDDIGQTFVLELKPFNRFEPPHTKRADTDQAILRLVQVLSAP